MISIKYSTRILPADDNNYPDNTPPGSNHSMGGGDELSSQSKFSGSNSSAFLKGGAGGNLLPNSSSSGSGSVSLGELTKMYPTPPSLEHNNIDQDSGLDEANIINNYSSLHQHNSNSIANPIKQEPPDEYGLFSGTGEYYNGPRDSDASKTLSVFRPSHLSMFIGSDSYRPLTDLPSLRDPVQILPNSVYRPSWQFNNNNNDKNSISNSNNSINNSNGNNPPNNSHCGGLSEKLSSQRMGSHLSSNLPPGSKLEPISPAVERMGGPSSVGAGGPSSVGGYDLASPASNQSSYLNKTIASVEQPSANTSTSNINGPEAYALIVNLVLMDSSVNVFRDHNFDSCTMCVCNNDQKVVGNVRGSDGGLYLPPSYLSPQEEPIACNCGFSAVINRRLAFQAGLFYEDEVDLTGLHEELMAEKKKPSLSLMLENSDKVSGNDSSNNNNSSGGDLTLLDRMPESLFKLVQQQCVDTLCINSSVVQRAAAMYRRTRTRTRLNLVELKDGNELVHLALEQARTDSDGMGVAPANSRLGPCLMHKWAYYQYGGPSCSQDLTRCMTTLQPHLQEAIQNKRSSKPWEPVFNVRGPLTWRQFHRMAVRGTEDMAEPLPIPMLLTGESQLSSHMCLE